ncbi:MAG: hypothetical protein JWM02_3536 [Frankiales bacterium]|nr:hypothetical protein [Frankiales bacterium]
MAPNRPTAPDAPSGSGERRRYNRRSAATEQSPPYFEIFERIAIALEGIKESLADQPPTTSGRRPSPPPR